MPKHNEVFGLERDNEVVAVASDRNLSLERTIDETNFFRQLSTPSPDQPLSYLAN